MIIGAQYYVGPKVEFAVFLDLTLHRTRFVGNSDNTRVWICFEELLIKKAKLLFYKFFCGLCEFVLLNSIGDIESMRWLVG